MNTGIPNVHSALPPHPHNRPFKNDFSRLSNHLTDRWYDILHEKNGADKDIVCAILYSLYSSNSFPAYNRT